MLYLSSASLKRREPIMKDLLLWKFQMIISLLSLLIGKKRFKY